MTRPTKIEYYLKIAKDVAERSPCSRRQFGAVIVNNDSIIATGYNGSVRGAPNCGIECLCLKDLHKEASYESYDNCPAIHGEVNAILNAARIGISVLGATLYLSSFKEGNGDRPCHLCRRVIINSGIKDCYFITKTGEVVHEQVESWIKFERDWIVQKGHF